MEIGYIFFSVSLVACTNKLFIYDSSCIISDIMMILNCQSTHHTKEVI